MTNALVHAVGHELPYQRMMVNSINSFYASNPSLLDSVTTYIICDDPGLDLSNLNPHIRVHRISQPSYNYFRFGIGLDRMVNYVFYKWEMFANPAFRGIDNLLYMDVDTEVVGDLSNVFGRHHKPGIYMADEDRNWLLNAPESELKAKLIGKVVTDEAYQSHGVVKSAGWAGHKFETFAPKGTQALYVEPFTYWDHGGHKYASQNWDGKQGQTAFGESEILFQAMTDYEIVDISVTGTGAYRHFEIKQQVVNQRSAKEIRSIWQKRMQKIGVTI